METNFSNQPLFGTQMDAIGTFIGNEMRAATWSINENINEVSRKIDAIDRKPKRSRVTRQIADLDTGELAVIDEYSDGTRSICAAIYGLRGPWRAYGVEIQEEDWDDGFFGLYFEGTQQWIFGKKKFLKRTSYIYELFTRWGTQFKSKISRGELKTALYEHFVSAISLTPNKIVISALPGWDKGIFKCSENTLFGFQEDMQTFPVLFKSFPALELREEDVENYFREMRGIKNGNDRFMILSYPFLAMLASILEDSDRRLNFGLNFIRCAELEKRRICSWLQIFNRSVCLPIDGEMTEKELLNQLRTIRDEVFIMESSVNENDSEYQKTKKARMLKKAFEVVLGEERLKGRSTGTVSAGICGISERFLTGKNIYNIFVAEDWCRRGEDKFIQERSMERILYAFSQFAEKEMEEIRKIMSKKRDIQDSRVVILEIGRSILNRFWAELGVDFLKKAGFQRELDLSTLFSQVSFDEEEVLEMFRSHFRKGVSEYYFLYKLRQSEREKDVIYYDDESLWFQTHVFRKMLKKCGMDEECGKILTCLKKEKMLKTDGEGMSVKLQIAGERFETYRISRQFFNRPGYADIITLGREYDAER